MVPGAIAVRASEAGLGIDPHIFGNVGLCKRGHLLAAIALFHKGTSPVAENRQKFPIRLKCVLSEWIYFTSAGAALHNFFPSRVRQDVTLNGINVFVMSN